MSHYWNCLFLQISLQVIFFSSDVTIVMIWTIAHCLSNVVTRENENFGAEIPSFRINKLHWKGRGGCLDCSLALAVCKAFFTQSEGGFFRQTASVQKRKKKSRGIKKKSQVFAPVPIKTMSYWNSTVQQRRHRVQM